jgi:glyoxylase-like metal-dependent hydrolase (beta-lactamase superfamily II)
MMHPSEYCNYHSRPGRTGKIIPVMEGEIISLGGRDLEIVHLPGHTPGSIGLLDRKYRILISGDPIQRNGRIYMFGPYRDLQAYIAGLEHLSAYKDAYDEIWPSHAELPLKQDVIEPLISGAEQILSGALEGRKETVHGREITAYDAGISVFLAD